jgi:hypothetical protein
MAVGRDSALSAAFSNMFSEIPEFTYAFVRNMLPVGILLLTLAGGTQILSRLIRMVLPPPPHVVHREAVELYQKGRTQEALEVWKRQTTHGRAFMSRACHDIYVLHKCKEGVEILDDAHERKVKLAKKEVDVMKLDAQAYRQGNAIMVLNEESAKQEYLGVAV